jgi:capsular polysaccharide biosynthesis protein
MELKEYLKIIKKNLRLFVGIVVCVLAVGFGYFLLRPVSYSTSLTLNITRSGVDNSQDYRYDDFYRLQADEKFAETVVQWLKSPRIVTDINVEAGRNLEVLNLKQLTKVFQADKLSSQVVSVKFSTPDKKTAEKTALAVAEVLEKNTALLNEDQKESTWFEVKSQNPVIMESKPDYRAVFLFSLLAGIFLAFWGVMIRHYLE